MTKIIITNDISIPLSVRFKINCGLFQASLGMQIILLLVIISLIVTGGFLLAFFWAVKDGQYDDDFTPSMRILIDDDMIEGSVSTISEKEVKDPTKTIINN